MTTSLPRTRGIAKVPVIIGVLALSAAGAAFLFMNSGDGDRVNVASPKTSGAYMPTTPEPLVREEEKESIDASEGEYIKYRDVTGRVVYRMIENLEATGSGGKFKVAASLMHGPRVKKNPKPPIAKQKTKVVDPPRFNVSDGKMVHSPSNDPNKDKKKNGGDNGSGPGWKGGGGTNNSGGNGKK